MADYKETVLKAHSPRPVVSYGDPPGLMAKSTLERYRDNQALPRGQVKRLYYKPASSREISVKILVVDDSRIMRNIIKNTVRIMHHMEESILEAADGEEAFRLLESNTIDLLLLDWNMPLLDGVNLVRRLRAKDRYKDLPIVMITSEAARYNVIEAVKAGVNDYLIKPVTEKALLEKVRKYTLEKGIE
jgi:two-component system chemotaxis response regulator CheY